MGICPLEFRRLGESSYSDKAVLVLHYTRFKRKYLEALIKYIKFISHNVNKHKQVQYIQ